MKMNMNDWSLWLYMVMWFCLDGVNEAGELIYGAFNLVDLVGSEWLSCMGVMGDCFKEV